MSACTDQAVLDRIADLAFAWLEDRRLPAGDTVAEIAFELAATGRIAPARSAAPRRPRLIALNGVAL